MMRHFLTGLFCLIAGVVSACPVPPTGLTLQQMYVQPDQHQVYEQGMWAIWFDPAFFTFADAQITADGLDSARCAALTDYGMRWPANIAAGVRFNVYLHVPGEDDGFGDYGWGNGVGENDAGLPFMTLPRGVTADLDNLSHEGFHVFQWEATSPGYVNDGDSGWFTETSAQWFMAERNPDGVDIHTTASTIAGNPQLALWHGFYNPEPKDPVHWMTDNRQYGMHLFIRYLGEVWGLPDPVFTTGFFDGTTLMPQEYLSRAVGRANFATAFADFAALMTASFVEGPGAPMPDWELSRTQRDASLVERARIMAETPLAGVENDITLELKVGADWASPPARLRPRPWSYNVLRIVQPQGWGTVWFETQAPGPMILRQVIRQGSSWVIEPLEPGQTIDLTKADNAYLVLVWAPPIYDGAQTADYRIRIDPVP